MCIKHAPCKDLLEYLQSLEDTNDHPYEGIPEDEVSLEDVIGLTIDPDNSHKVENTIIPC